MNKTVLISGGSSGLGLATTKAFRKKGAKVIIASRTLEKFKTNLGHPTSNLIYIETDFNDLNSVRQLNERILNDYPTLDIAINNVGKAIMKPIVEMTDEDFDISINVNFKSLWLCLKNQILLMRKDKKRQKHIINVSSINGLGGTEGLSLYSATKAGVISLTKSAALETSGSNISINTIVPGPFDTPMLDKLMEIQAKGNQNDAEVIKNKYREFIPQGRLGSPDEFARTVLWLCEENSFISGHSLIIDGGISSRFR